MISEAQRFTKYILRDVLPPRNFPSLTDNFRKILISLFENLPWCAYDYPYFQLKSLIFQMTLLLFQKSNSKDEFVILSSICDGAFLRK